MPTNETFKKYKKTSCCYIPFYDFVGTCYHHSTALYQLFESHLYNTDKYNVTRTVTVPASRGNIYSDDLSLLATSIPEYEIRWDAKQVNKELFLSEVETLSEQLSELFEDKSAEEYSNMLRKIWAKQSRYALIKEKSITMI